MFPNLLKVTLLSLLLILIISVPLFSQGFLRADGTKIVNDNGEVLLRGMGPGGWMLQEGYMLKTEAFANPQHEIRQRVVDLIGEEKTDAFYDAWYENHFTRADADSMAAWGFNSVRVPIHYNLFTLPIEEEPVHGEHTWLDRGFEMLDELLEWCEQNEMYLIIDLHAAPGGQGQDAAISDYDPSKPSLWESEENKTKTIALWRKLAERYVDEEWIGGFDLINEVNWPFDEPNNAPMWDLFRDITEAIREVNNNHMIIIGGNWWGNDYSGLNEPFDDNLVYSFHKYWNHNDQESIQFALNLRDSHNVPIWMGEAGENSNVWFTDAIKLLEANNIGWAWWAWKKFDTITGTVSVPLTDDYNTLLSFWRNGGTTPSGEVTAEFAENTLMEMTEMIKLENCDINTTVIDAMFRQVQTEETRPFADHTIPGYVNATDFDYGRIGRAYYDEVDATYHVSSGSHTPWNNGWSYRNDAVDIERSSDESELSNGYNIGWTAPGEWMQYTVEVEETAIYELKVRFAGLNTNTQIFFELDEVDVTGPIDLPATGGWQNWEYKTVDQHIVLHEGTNKIRLNTLQGGANYGYFELEAVSSIIDSLAFNALSARVDSSGHNVRLTLNAEIQTPLEASDEDFDLFINGSSTEITNVSIGDGSERVIVIEHTERIFGGMEVKLSYSGNQIENTNGVQLATFSNLSVTNSLPSPHAIPGRIQAQDWIRQSGLSLEEVNDESGEYNFGYTNNGDYADYLIHVEKDSDYYVNFRVATIRSTGTIQLQLVDEDDEIIVLGSYEVPNTGGWQSWETITGEATLPAGYHTLRLYIEQQEFNVNWFEFFHESPTSIDSDRSEIPRETTLQENFPNPFNPATQIKFGLAEDSHVQLIVYDLLGRRVATLVNEIRNAGWHRATFDASSLASGIYLYRLETINTSITKKMMLIK